MCIEEGRARARVLAAGLYLKGGGARRLKKRRAQAFSSAGRSSGAGAGAPAAVPPVTPASLARAAARRRPYWRSRSRGCKATFRYSGAFSGKGRVVLGASAPSTILCMRRCACF